MKITALPFMIGTLGYSFFASGDYSFTIGAGLLLGILVLTKQLDII